jgi:hypothetical protein
MSSVACRAEHLNSYSAVTIDNYTVTSCTKYRHDAIMIVTLVITSKLDIAERSLIRLKFYFMILDHRLNVPKVLPCTHCSCSALAASMA